MTTNWRELTGRELDRYIAERLGLEVVQIARGGAHWLKTNDPDRFEWIPEYSANADVALTLIRGATTASIHYGEVSTLTGQVWQVDLFYPNREPVTECGDELALAICRAWLAYMER